MFLSVEDVDRGHRVDHCSERLLFVIFPLILSSGVPFSFKCFTTFHSPLSGSVVVASLIRSLVPFSTDRLNPLIVEVLFLPLMLKFPRKLHNHAEYRVMFSQFLPLQ